MIQQPGMGARLFDLFWLVCFPALLIGAWSMLMVRYWASLCTNRVLLINMIKVRHASVRPERSFHHLTGDISALSQVYMCVQAFLFIFVLWCTCVLFILFKPFDWQNKLQLRDYFATFFFSTAFILPYLLAIVYYLLDLSYYLEELAYPQVDIEEPYPPQYDLSELSLTDLCLGWLAVPIALCIQLYDIYRGLKNAYVKVRQHSIDSYAPLTLPPYSTWPTGAARTQSRATARSPRAARSRGKACPRASRRR